MAKKHKKLRQPEDKPKKKVEEQPIVKITAEEESEIKGIKESQFKSVKQVRAVTLDHKCPNCSSKIEYSIDAGKWLCKYCDSSFSLEEMQSKVNNAATAKNNEDTDDIDDEDTFVEYTCPDCGAQVVCEKDDVSTFCIYCGNTAILRNRLSGKFRPTYIIPFEKKIEEAKEAFSKISKGKILCPKGFTSESNIEKIKGLYVPFWFFSFDLESSIDALGTTHRTWISGDTHYHQTNYFKLVREGNLSYEKVPMDGSSHFDDDLMNCIEPFDYKKLKPYNHAYLSGFLAERYDMDSSLMYSKAYDRVIKTSESILLDTCVGYTSKVIRKSDHVITSYKIEYALLPVYMVNVKYKGKYYTFAMNGESGKMIGNIPIDIKRVFALFGISFIVVFIIVYIILKILYMIAGV